MELMAKDIRSMALEAGIEPKPYRPPASELVLLPSTEELERRAEVAGVALETLKAGVEGPSSEKPRLPSRFTELGAVRKAESDYQWALTQLDHGRYRDELQAERPEGCWCLGTGGKYQRYLTEGIYACDEYCPCPEGEQVKQSVAQHVALVRAERRRKEVAALFEQVAIPHRFWNCTFDSYPVTDDTRAAFEFVRWWATPPEDEAEWEAWWEKRKKSLFIYGPFGRGKTGLAAAMARHHIEQMAEPTLFITVPNLLDRIRSTYGKAGNGTESEVIETVKNVEFLVLDDLGAERVTDWVAEKLFTIINHRHDEDLETVFTSNLSLEQLADHIGERTTWRIVEMANVVELTGPNLRDRP